MILQTENIPRSYLSLARIIETYAGKDGSKPNLNWRRRMFLELYKKNDIMFCLVGNLYFAIVVLSFVIL